MKPRYHTLVAWLAVMFVCATTVTAAEDDASDALLSVDSGVVVKAGTVPPASAIAALAAAISGTVLTAADPAFADHLFLDNSRCLSVPLLFVLPRNAQDVGVAMQFASNWSLPFTVKSGGHSAQCYSLVAQGLVLDMALYRAITIDVDAQTVTVQPGARWADVYDAITPTGLVPVGGGCVTVSPAGFVLGGGFSFVSRSYGLAIDNLLAMTLVTADGAVHALSDDAAAPGDSDLWWAVRGGGGGNFGVTLDMTFRVHPPPSPTILAGELCWPIVRGGGAGTSTPVMRFVQSGGFAAGAPDALAVYAIYLTNHTTGAPTMCLTVVYNGPYSDGEQAIAPLLAYQPAVVALHNVSFLEFEALNANVTSVDARKAYIKSGMFVTGSITDDVVDVFESAMLTAPSPNSTLLLTHLGGAIAARDDNSTAYAHRDALYSYQVKAIWDTAAQAAPNMAWVTALGDALAPAVSGAYVNYIEQTLPDWPRAYYRGHYPTLQTIKANADPTNFFSFAQSIVNA